MAGQIVLKSQNAIDNLADLPDINYYINRVKADGGVIYNMNALLDVFAFIYSKTLLIQKFLVLSIQHGG